MDKLTGAKLDVLQATCEAMIKRQGILAAMIASPNYESAFRVRKLEEMSKVLDEWTIRVKDIEENFNGK